MTKRPVVVLYDGCTLVEIVDFLSLFQEYAPHLVVVGNHGETIRTTEGLTLSALENLPDGNLSGLDPVLVPGGDVGSAIGDDSLRAFLRATYAEGATIGGICNGVWLLADAGLLEGRRCTHTGHPSCGAPQEVVATAAPLFEKSVYVHENVVVDDRIVTAKPWARGEFTIQLALLAGILLEDRVELLRDYFRGEYKS
jgi:transcriptional regulator GlxA family with amidase domain